MASYRDRYFTEALPHLAGRPRPVVQRLSRLLFPSILVSRQTIQISENYTDTGLIGIDGRPKRDHAPTPLRPDRINRQSGRSQTPWSSNKKAR
jgi:hypothetical protein